MLKARPNFSSRYAGATVECLYRYVGAHATHDIVGSTMRMVAVQFLPELLGKASVSGSSLADVARFHAELLRACRRPFDMVEDGDERVTIAVSGRAPFTEDHPDDLFRAGFEFHAMATRLMNGHVRPSWSCADSQELWTFEDTGHWLW